MERCVSEQGGISWHKKLEVIGNHCYSLLPLPAHQRTEKYWEVLSIPHLT